MPIHRLKKSDFENRTNSAGHAEYVAFLQAAKVGDGGRLIVSEEGKSRPTIKNRMKQAAKITGRTIKFYRSPATEVVFQVVE
jgi:hypothetical protein